MAVEFPPGVDRDPPSRRAWTARHGLTEAEREQALALLKPPIERIARRAALAYPRALREELIADALGLVWERLPKWDPGKGPFLAWCRVVLGNVLKDRLDRCRRDVLARTEAHDPDTLGLPAAEPAGESEPFSRTDLARMEAWPASDRVVLLCWFGLWRRVPEPVWLGWLAACDLEPPVPPEGFDPLDRKAERYAALAPALGVSRNTLCQRLRRALARNGLDQLEALDPAGRHA
jgi:DNA-directed RNA polymerase specialized sigma24 family protein